MPAKLKNPYINVKISAKAHKIFRSMALARGLEFYEMIDIAAKPYEHLISQLQVDHADSKTPSHGRDGAKAQNGTD